MFGPNPIEVVNSYVYLGVWYDYNNLKSHLARHIKLTRTALFSILSKSQQLQPNVDVQCQLFTSTILPIILYGSEVWVVRTTIR